MGLGLSMLWRARRKHTNCSKELCGKNELCNAASINTNIIVSIYVSLENILI